MKRSFRPALLAVPVVMLLLGITACSGEEPASGSTPVAKVATDKEATTSTVAPVVAGKATYLSDIPLAFDTSTISPVNGPVKINTQTFQNGTYSNLGCMLGGSWDYDLNRGYKQLTATAGVSDGSPAEDKVTFTFTGDGRELGRADVTLGTPVPVTLNVDGVLRLSVEVGHSLGTFCVQSSQVGTYAALGDPTLTK